MNTYVDNTEFVRSLKNSSTNTGNSGKIDIGIAIGIGIIMLIGSGVLLYQNIQLRKTIKIENMTYTKKKNVPICND